MKAAAVYKVVRETLGPWCKRHGFKRQGALGWFVPLAANDFFTFWFQLTQEGWDDFAGSKLVVEFQRASSPAAGAAGTRRNRIVSLLSDAELATVTRMENEVIRKLRKPPRDHFIYTLQRSTIDWYEAKFEPREANYSRRDDVWFRYFDADDVKQWAEFVLARLPRIVATFAPEYAQRLGIAIE